LLSVPLPSLFEKLALPPRFTADPLCRWFEHDAAVFSLRTIILRDAAAMTRAMPALEAPRAERFSLLSLPQIHPF